MPQGIRWTEPQKVRVNELLTRGLFPAAIARTINAEFSINVTRKAVYAYGVRHKHGKRERTDLWQPGPAARMLELWAQGFSGLVVAAKLNEEFGTSYTRNAVMGRAHRLGLEKRKTLVAKVRTRQPSTRIRFRLVRPSKPTKPTKPPKPPKPEPIEIQDTLIPFEQRRQLIDLGPNECRWPVGDVGEPDFFFCGGKADDGCSYCPGHLQRSIGYHRPTGAGFNFRRAA